MVGKSTDILGPLAPAGDAADFTSCPVGRGGKYLVAPLVVCPFGFVPAMAAFVAG